MSTRKTAKPSSQAEWTYANEKGARDFGNFMVSEQPEISKEITELTIIVNGSTWTDNEDDLWAFALHAFQAHSHRLQHLKLVVKGNVLFTKHNIVKTILSSALVIKKKPDKRSRATQRSIPNESDAEDSAFAPTPKRQRMSNRVTGGGGGSGFLPQSYLPEISKEETSPSYVEDESVKLGVETELIWKNKPLALTPAQVYPKAIIEGITSLHSPVLKITMEGAFELSLRVHILDKLRPDWREDAYCSAQGGHSAEVTTAFQKAREIQESMMRNPDSLVPVGGEKRKDDDQDRGLRKAEPGTRRQERSGENADVAAWTRKWTMPSGKAHRVIMGWKGVQSWTGPPII